MKLRLIISFLTLLTVFTVQAQQEDDSYRWALRLGLGQGTADDNSPDGQDLYFNDDESNAFKVGADYYLTHRWVLTGDIKSEQMGVLTDLASGIGLKKYNMLGVGAGIKYYFFPRKWILQPHVGAGMEFNFLNLSEHNGRDFYTAEQGWPGSHLVMDYSLKAPFATVLAPQVGVDLRLISSLSLTFDFGWSFAMGGHNREEVRFTDGVMAGQSAKHELSNMRTNVMLGLKMDFPARRVSKQAVNNLFNWILCLLDLMP